MMKIPTAKSLIVFVIVAATSQVAMSSNLSEPLSSFEPLVGKWACVGTSHPTPNSPEYKFEASFNFSPVHEGQWLQVEYSEEVSEAHPKSRSVTEFWGASADGFTTTFFNVFGQSGTLISDGLKDQSIVWRGEIMTPGGLSPFQGDIKITSSSGITVTPSIGLPDGGWFKIATLDCGKS